MQALGEIRLIAPFAFAGARTLGPAEDLEEIGIESRVGQLHGPRARRQPVELLIHSGHLVDCVEQGLGPKSLGIVARKALLVAGVELIWLGAQLIRARIADRAN